MPLFYFYRQVSFWAIHDSSEIPITAPFPPCGENCALVGISSLSAPTRSAGLGAESGNMGCGPHILGQRMAKESLELPWLQGFFLLCRAHFKALLPA